MGRIGTSCPPALAARLDHAMAKKNKFKKKPSNPVDTLLDAWEVIERAISNIRAFEERLLEALAAGRLVRSGGHEIAIGKQLDRRRQTIGTYFCVDKRIFRNGKIVSVPDIEPAVLTER